MQIINYRSASDDELAFCADTNDEAYSELISRYLPSLRRLASIYSKTHADRDDLVSEGILGLMNAIKTFSPEKGASFSTYAGVCMNNRMLSALKKSQRIRKSEEPYDGISHGEETSPEKIVIDREILNEIFSEVSEKLSERERAVFSLYLQGVSYSEIAEILKIDRKSVDNALARVRTKLRRKFR